jgi:DNA-binding winged helix-turn-helix (wHTH) protein
VSTDELPRPSRLGFRLGELWVEPELDRVVRGADRLHLEPKVMEVLLVLAKHAGHVVSKEILLDRVWGSRFVAESTLSRAIAELRRALGDDAHEPRYIETVPRRGYRLVGAVERPGTPPPASLPAGPAAERAADPQAPAELNQRIEELEAQIAALEQPKSGGVRDAWAAVKRLLGLARES